MIFSRAGIVAGARQVLPLALSVFSYGLVFGVLAGQAGLNLGEAVLMSGLVFAGSSQFVALGLWTHPLPVLTIVLTTIVVNLRLALMSAALSPIFRQISRVAAYGSVLVLADENWALTMADVRKGNRNAAFLLGGGLVLYIAWLAATVVGRVAGGALRDPSRFGLDFAFTAVFIALLVGLWRGRQDVLPWAVTAVVAVAANHLLPGKWYILAGALIGSGVGAWRDAH